MFYLHFSITRVRLRVITRKILCRVSKPKIKYLLFMKRSAAISISSSSSESTDYYDSSLTDEESLDSSDLGGSSDIDTATEEQRQHYDKFIKDSFSSSSKQSESEDSNENNNLNGLIDVLPQFAEENFRLTLPVIDRMNLILDELTECSDKLLTEFGIPTLRIQRIASMNALASLEVELREDLTKRNLESVTDAILGNISIPSGSLLDVVGMQLIINIQKLKSFSNYFRYG